jgi:large subunit ribosomal protein L15
MGYGRVGQHRKGGMRGGKGKAGGRKHFWIRTVKYEPERYSKVGFKPPSAFKPRPKTINVGELEDLALNSSTMKEFESEKKIIDLNLQSLGYGKLLGSGNVEVPFRIRVSAYSSRALEKVRAVGGEIIGIE